MTTPSREVAKLTAEAFAAEAKRAGRAVLPVGSLEIHGRHAPLGLDGYTAEHIALALAESVDALAFPPVWYANCSLGYEARQWPGTLSIDAESEVTYLTAIAGEIARQGIERLVFVNGHGPNSSLLEIAAYKVWGKTGMAMGVLEWWTAARETIKGIKGFAYGNHADEIETSIFLATPHGALADLSAAAVNPTGPQVGDAELGLYFDHMRYTHTFDERWIGKSGNFGDPTRATKEKGDAIVAATVEVGKKMFAALEPYVDRAKLERWKKGGNE